MSDLAQAALVSGFFAVVVVIVQAFVARMNSRQHGMVDTKIDDLADSIRNAGVDFRGLRQDVRDLDHKVDVLRGEDTRRHEENLVHLEKHDAQLAAIDGHVTDLDTHVTDLDGSVASLAARVTALEPPPPDQPTED